jgi:hypothetical protein
MADMTPEWNNVPDLTTQGLGVHADAEPLVMQQPRIEHSVPGAIWEGELGHARAVLRFPDAALWNGKLMIGATPAVRTERSLDLLLSDIALQRGYAYAACDKGTPMLTLRDPSRQMTEWPGAYQALTEAATQAASMKYGRLPSRTYISGLSNGGYITRIMLEKYPELFDGGVEWEGVMWRGDDHNLLACWDSYVQDYPIYCNWRGDRSQSERSQALGRLLDAGLHPGSEPYWSQYFMFYWIVSLWLYGRNLDPDWPAFQLDWSNDWLRNPSPLAYPWQERREIVLERIESIANTGRMEKPLLSVAGNWDCLTPFRYNAQAYAELVRDVGFAANHRLYEVDRGNHVDGFLRTDPGQQQAVHPYYEAALLYLDDWVENNHAPPASGLYETIDAFAPGRDLYTKG